jgi:transposase
MAREGILMLRQKELKRLHIIKKVLEKGIKQVEAAGILGLSSRQIRRIVKRVNLEGDKGVIHKSRGQPSKRCIADAVKAKIIGLYRSQYGDFGPTLASEKLQERDQLRVSDETLRLWLLESGDWEKRRKTRRHRRWRERKGHRGEMVQMDGSHHDWFEERGPECVLMSYIDDATGRVFARFYEYEGTMPAMDSFKQYSRKYGLPISLYLDRHTTYKSPAKVSKEDILNEEVPLSEFERALKELGVELIHAMSPQAKGRVERLFRTLQDRLVKEMRLRGIGTIEEANEFLKQYLPVYNRRFSVLPRQRLDLHRPLPKGFNLDAVLCIKTERRLRNDFTVAHNKKLYQIEDRTRASKVMVHEYMNGSLRMTYRDQPLRFKEIATRPLKQEKGPLKEQIRRPPLPAANHPWRKGFKFGRHRYERGKPILTPQNAAVCAMQGEAQG